MSDIFRSTQTAAINEALNYSAHRSEVTRVHELTDSAFRAILSQEGAANSISLFIRKDSGSYDGSTPQLTGMAPNEEVMAIDVYDKNAELPSKISFKRNQVLLDQHWVYGGKITEQFLLRGEQRDKQKKKVTGSIRHSLLGGGTGPLSSAKPLNTLNPVNTEPSVSYIVVLPHLRHYAIYEIS